MPHILDEELYQAGMAIAACPTAPCHEAHVRACLLERLHDLPNVATHLDEFGNLHATYEYDTAAHEPFRLVAHMDHPGFVVHRDRAGEELHFAGGVEEKYFPEKPIVFYNEESREPVGRAFVEATSFSDDVKRVTIDRPIPEAATFAMWELT
jgi:putative aminopeptidase FrvX